MSLKCGVAWCFGGRREGSSFHVKLAPSSTHATGVYQASPHFTTPTLLNFSNGEIFIPQVYDAVMHVRDRVGPAGRCRVARRGVDGAAACSTCPCPALQLLFGVLHSSQATLVVNASSGRIHGMRAAGQSFAVTFGRGAWVPCLLQYRCHPPPYFDFDAQQLNGNGSLSIYVCTASLRTCAQCSHVKMGAPEEMAAIDGRSRSPVTHVYRTPWYTLPVSAQPSWGRGGAMPKVTQPILSGPSPEGSTGWDKIQGHYT